MFQIVFKCLNVTLTKTKNMLKDNVKIILIAINCKDREPTSGYVNCETNCVLFFLFHWLLSTSAALRKLSTFTSKNICLGKNAPLRSPSLMRSIFNVSSKMMKESVRAYCHIRTMWNESETKWEITWCEAAKMKQRKVFILFTS